MGGSLTSLPFAFSRTASIAIRDSFRRSNLDRLPVQLHNNVQHGIGKREIKRKRYLD